MTASTSGKNLLLTGGAAVCLRGFGALGLLLVTILVNRLLPQEAAGAFFLALMLLTLVSSVGTLGMDTAALKFMALEKNRGEHGFFKKAMQWTGWWGALLAVVATVGYWGYCRIAAVAFAPEFLLLIPAAAALTLNKVQAQGLFAHHRIYWGTFLQTGLVAWLFLILFLAGAVTGEGGRTFGMAVVWYAVASLVALAVGLRLLHSEVTAEQNNVPSLRTVLHLSLPLLTISLLNTVLDASDKFMLSWFDSVASVAPYEAARQSIRGGELLLAACNNIVAPRFAALWHEQRRGEAESLLKKSTAMMFGFSLLLLVGYLLFGRYLMYLNNPDFVGLTDVLLILAVGQSFALGTGPVAHFLMMTGKERWHRNCVIGCVVGNVLLNFILIPRYGIYGAAIATSVCLALKNIVAFMLAFYCLKTSQSGSTGAL